MAELFPLKNEESGFTLIELLLVLLVVSVLSLIMIPSMMHSIQHIETDNFFKVMSSDILYMQNQSLGKSDYLRIVYYDDHYTIRDEFTGRVTKRPYPSHLSLNQTYRFTFSSSGTVKNPGSFLFISDRSNYQVTFPLGKGRHYIETIK